jgi:RimJ/RimL family protein N-acetyltransferase
VSIETFLWYGCEMTPRLETARLVLEPFTEAHLSERYVSWLNDPEVVRYSENRHREFSLASCRDYLASFNDSPNQFWALTHDRVHIGNISAHHDLPNRTADVGILIGEKSVWGQGYGAEAWRAACDWLLLNGVRKITAGTMEANRAMLSIFRKTGMIEDGVRKAHFLLDGTPVDCVYAARQ